MLLNCICYVSCFIDINEVHFNSLYFDCLYITSVLALCYQLQVDVTLYQSTCLSVHVSLSPHVSQSTCLSVHMSVMISYVCCYVSCLHKCFIVHSLVG